jgi:heme exporter protein B
MRLLRSVIGRELRLAARHGGDTAGAVLFFLVAGALFPLAVGPSPATLARIAPGIVWVTALLAALLPLDRLWGADLEDGSLDLLVLAGGGASQVALGKAIAHWLLTGLPLLGAAVPLAAMLRLPMEGLPRLLAGLAMGTAVLSLLGCAAAAVVLGARRGGVLLPVLVLPLSVPVVIFGAGAAEAGVSEALAGADLSLLAAMLAACLPLCPIAAGAGVRAALEA